ncbi:MAG: hypothetical protein RIQ56_403 [Candidatus Parcubacteria bacterium]|jgi:3-phosphoshikimate 1-carboxyvinyltransferase
MRLTPLSEPVQATVSIPGSKSYTNRALLMAAISGNCRIENPLDSEDTVAMQSCLETLGVRFRRDTHSIEVLNSFKTSKDEVYELDANISGTTLRFLLPVICAIPGTKILGGKEGLNKRPIGDLVDAVRQLGAHVEYQQAEGFPPLRILPVPTHSGVVRANGTVSSQYISALLLSAPLLEGGVIIEVEGEQISKPYIDMTIDSMRQFGVGVINEDYRRYIVQGGEQYTTGNYVVEGDVSSASYFAAIATLTKSRITLTNLNPSSKQADMHFFEILAKMGTRVSKGENEMIFQGNGVLPLEVDMENCPDQAQTLAVLAAFADGVTKITGVRSLRVKETERVKAVEQELAKMGIRTESTQDTLTIYGGNPKPTTIDTYGDHRMAMAFAVAGTALDGMEINNPEVAAKTFPDFWEKLRLIGVTAE